MAHKEERPALDEFQPVKSLVNSPDPARGNPGGSEHYNFKENNDKPYLSDQAKLLLEELHKYKETYKTKPKDDPTKSQPSASEKARQIAEDHNKSPKPPSLVSTQKNPPKPLPTETNSNFYSLTEPFTFEARDMEHLEFHSEAKDPQPKNPLAETQKEPSKESMSNDPNSVKKPQTKPTSPAKLTSPKPKPALPSTKPRVFELDLNKPTTTKPGSSKALLEDPTQKPTKDQPSDKKLPEANITITIVKPDPQPQEPSVNKSKTYDKLINPALPAPNNQELIDNNNPLSKGHPITDSIQTVIRKDSGHANYESRPSAGNNEIPTPLTLKGSFQSATGQAQFNSVSSLSNLLRSVPEYQRSHSHQPKTEPSSTKDLKMKGFQMQIDNIINNCFSSFLYKSFSPVKPSNFASHKQESSGASANFPLGKQDPGFFSSDEKKRMAPPFFDSLGREMEGVLRKIKAEIAQKTDAFTHNYRGDAELRKSRFITEVQQAVKSSLEELEQQVPVSGRGGSKIPSIHKDLGVQTGEKTPVSQTRIAKDLEEGKKNGPVDKEFIEEIVKKTTNEMVLSLMKSNLLDTPAKREELSRSVEVPAHSNQKEASFLTTNFQRKKAEILTQIEYIDREIEQMVKRDESLENSVENGKNSFLSSPLELPDPYFKPKLRSKNSDDTKSKIISIDKTHSISATKNNTSFKPEVKRIKSPPPPPPNTAKKDRDFVRKIVTSRPVKSDSQKSGFNKPTPILAKTAHAGFKRTNPQLSSFEERNRKWLEEREMKILKSKEKMDGQSRECTFKPTKFSRQPRIDQSKDRTLTTGGTPERKKKDIQMTPVNKFYQFPSNYSKVKKSNTGTLKATIAAVQRKLGNPKPPGSLNPSIEKHSQLGKANLLERRKMLTEKKAPAPKALPVRNASAFQRKPTAGAPGTQTMPATGLKAALAARKAAQPSVFKKTKSNVTETISKPKHEFLRKNNSSKFKPANSPLKSPNSSNRNETSLEVDVRSRKTGNGKETGKTKKGEMKELIGVLINLTKTLKEKSQGGDDGSEKTIEAPFEQNVRSVFPNDQDREKLLNTPKLRLENDEMEEIATEKTLIEKVRKELVEEEEEDVELLIGKGINVEKFNGLLSKANQLTEQIQRTLNSAERF